MPVALAIALLLLFSGRSTWAWIIPFAVAVIMTVATKIAFIGWGLGIASLNFTGLSGHAMTSAAIYPLLGHLLNLRKQDQERGVYWPGVLAGYAIAILVAVSRLFVHAHSPSEVVGGFLLGATVSALGILLLRGTPRPRSPFMNWAVAVWLIVIPLQVPASSSHGFVTHLALLLSQHDRPYQRADLYRPEHEHAAVYRFDVYHND